MVFLTGGIGIILIKARLIMLDLGTGANGGTTTFSNDASATGVGTIDSTGSSKHDKWIFYCFLYWNWKSGNNSTWFGNQAPE